MANTQPAPATVKPTDPVEVVITYDLFELPTAFHKAGLAGLMLLIESLMARRLISADETNYELSATGAKVTFTAALLRRLMDDLYDARKIEVAVKSKWSGAGRSRARSCRRCTQAPPSPGSGTASTDKHAMILGAGGIAALAGDVSETREAIQRDTESTITVTSAPVPAMMASVMLVPVTPDLRETLPPCPLTVTVAPTPPSGSTVPHCPLPAT